MTVTLRQFIYARLQNEIEVAASELVMAQRMGPDGLYLFPGAHLKMELATKHKDITLWFVERRLWDVPRSARIQTMKALAYRWRTHPDYLKEWTPE